MKEELYAQEVMVRECLEVQACKMPRRREPCLRCHARPKSFRYCAPEAAAERAAFMRLRCHGESARHRDDAA